MNGTFLLLFNMIHGMVRSENTCRWVKDHCTACLQFNKTRLAQGRKYAVLYAVKELNPNL